MPKQNITHNFPFFLFYIFSANVAFMARYFGTALTVSYSIIFRSVISYGSWIPDSFKENWVQFWICLCQGTLILGPGQFRTDPQESPMAEPPRNWCIACLTSRVWKRGASGNSIRIKSDSNQCIAIITNLNTWIDVKCITAAKHPLCDCFNIVWINKSCTDQKGRESI